MCAPNLIGFLLFLYLETILFGAISGAVDGFWLLVWCLCTGWLGWRLLKAEFGRQRDRIVTIRMVDKKRLLVPLLLLMPGILTDATALSIAIKRSISSEQRRRRKRASQLWIGEIDADGVIPVEAVVIESRKDDPN